MLSEFPKLFLSILVVIKIFWWYTNNFALRN